MDGWSVISVYSARFRSYQSVIIHKVPFYLLFPFPFPLAIREKEIEDEVVEER